MKKPSKQKIIATIILLIGIYITGRISDSITYFLVPDSLIQNPPDPSTLFTNPEIASTFFWFAVFVSIVNIFIYGIIGYIFVSWLLNKKES